MVVVVAVLVTSVVRTRLRDMEQLMDAEQQQQQQQQQTTLTDSIMVDTSREPDEEMIREVKS